MDVTVEVQTKEMKPKKNVIKVETQHKEKNASDYEVEISVEK